MPQLKPKGACDHKKKSRASGAFGNTLYAEFQHGNADKAAVNFSAGDVNFHEFYDASADKWQMHNLFNATSQATLDALHTKLHDAFNCAGDACP